MSLITKFDPWNFSLCTCPPKLSLNPYTGCSHGCLYCYASSYIPNFFQVREKKNYLRRLEKEIKKIPKNLPVSLANSSDPYPPREKEACMMRKTLKLLENYKKLIVTKSDLVVRDIDLLENAVVSLSINTVDENLTRRVEPGAPEPGKRLKALEKISRAGIPTILRLDPIIPGLNDKYSDIEKVIKEAKKAGARHVISSTYKAKPDNFQRMSKVFPKLAEKWRKLYLKKGKKVQGSFYLPKELRIIMMKKAKEISENFELSFAGCREGFPFLNTEVCDGSYLLKE